MNTRWGGAARRVAVLAVWVAAPCAAEPAPRPTPALAQLDAQVTEAASALLRSAAESGGTTPDWSAALRQQPQGAAIGRVAALLDAIERHHAYSPSLYAYGDFNALLRRLNPGELAEAAAANPAVEPLRRMVDARVARLGALRRTLSADFRATPRDPVARSSFGGFAELLDRRQARARARLGDRTRPGPPPSHFRDGGWVIGWAGGPLAQRLKSDTAGSARYALSFEAYGVWDLAGVVEMAKQHRAAVRAQFGTLNREQADLTQTVASIDGRLETLTLDISLPAYGVTATGLVAGRLQRAAFQGDPCAGEGASRTRVEVAFPQAVTGDLLALVVTSAPLEVAKARVKVERRSFLSPLLDLFENTLTERQTVTVDVDGDGVDDLRVMLSNDGAVSRAPPGAPRMALKTVAGWYANNVYLLEANIDGGWRTLSRYNVTTCT